MLQNDPREEARYRGEREMMAIGVAIPYRGAVSLRKIHQQTVLHFFDALAASINSFNEACMLSMLKSFNLT